MVGPNCPARRLQPVMLHWPGDSSFMPSLTQFTVKLATCRSGHSGQPTPGEKYKPQKETAFQKAMHAMPVWCIFRCQKPPKCRIQGCALPVALALQEQHVAFNNSGHYGQHARHVCQRGQTLYEDIYDASDAEGKICMSQ